MNYIGSKASLLPFLDEGIRSRINAEARVFFDVFAGTGIVGWHFKQIGYQIISNDVQYYAYCLNRSLVGINDQPEFRRLQAVNSGAGEEKVDAVLDHLNRVPGETGFVFSNFCSGGTKKGKFRRLYFSDENGQRCDAIRCLIESWREEGQLEDDEYFYLLASLIDAVDRVANTASVYGAFLKHIKKSAMKPLQLGRLPLAESEFHHPVFNMEGSELIEQVECDVLYMDPPYNHRQYGANYHVLETIARYDSPVLSGVTGLRPYQHQKSDFCVQKKALPALGDMISRSQARFVFLSYNSEGIMDKEDILSVMRKYGKASVMTKDRSRFRADVDRENRVYKADRVNEYLFCLEKFD